MNPVSNDVLREAEWTAWVRIPDTWRPHLVPHPDEVEDWVWAAIDSMRQSS